MNENIVDKRVYKTLTKIENGMIRLLEDKRFCCKVEFIV